MNCVTIWSGGRIVLLLALVATAAPAMGQPVTPTARAGWRIGGPVVALGRLGPIVYLGGNFRGIAPEGNGAGNVLVVGSATGQPLPFPGFDGNVSAIESDGAGGWFVGGNFVSAQDGGTQSRFRLAHVLDTGHLDPAWTPRADGGQVRALKLVPGIGLFVGGDFTSLSGSARSKVGLLDPVSGAVQPWTYDVAGGSATVRTLAYDGGTLFIGGGFTTVDGLSRPNLVAVSATVVGQAGPDLGAAAQVETVSVASSGLLYVGGSFTTLKGQPRLRLARVTHVGGALDVVLDPWNPGANGTVRAVAAAAPDAVFVGGDFTTIGGQARAGLARLDAAGGTPTAFSAGESVVVSALTVAGDTLYAAGPFEFVSGAPRNSVAAFSISTGNLLPWNPAPAGTVFAVGAQGSQVALAGSLTGFGASPATYLAAVNLQTGQLLPWSPRVNGIVRSMAVVGAAVYVGGEFTSAGGAARNGLAALDAVTGSALPWNPNVNGSVAQMRADASSLYVVGSFSTVGGQPRNMLARVRLSDGSADPAFAPSVVAAGVTALQTLLLDGPRLYVGGGLVTFGSAPSTRLAMLDATTGAVLGSFAASVNGPVQRMDLDGGFLYITGGSFSQVNGQARTSLAKLDAATGALQPWAPQLALDPNLVTAGFGGSAADVDAQGSVALISGAFSTVNGLLRNGIAQVDTTTGATTAWTPTLGVSSGGFGTTILAAPDVTIVGGGRIRTADEFLNGIVIFAEPSAQQPLPPSGLTAVVTGSTLRVLWTAPPLARTAIAYVLEAGTARGLTDIGQVNVGATELVVTGVPPGTYFIRVRAVTALGTSQPTADLAITVGGSGCVSPPAPPSAPAVTVTGSTILFQWYAQVGSPPSSYELHAGSAPGLSNLAVVELGTTALTVPGVPPGIYYVRLHAKNPCGTSLPGPEVAVNVGDLQSPPGAPLALNGTAAGGTVSLQWTAPPLAAVIGYRLEAGNAPGLSNLADIAVTGTSVVAGGVPPGVYFIRVRAFNAAGVSVASNELMLLMP